MSAPRPTVVWITGLPGAGKTTVSKLVVEGLKQRTAAVVRLDGDLFREVMGNDVGYDPEGRLANARRLARMCKLLVDQGLVVVCATVSLFKEIHDWNRANFPSHLEVFLKVSDETLHARDQKGLFSQAKSGAVSHVVGANQSFDVPADAHLVIDNDGQLTPAQVAARILERVP